MNISNIKVDPMNMPLLLFSNHKLLYKHTVGVAKFQVPTPAHYIIIYAFLSIKPNYITD